MKRIFSMICAVAICLGMSGCRPVDVDKNTYKLGKEAISIIDDYLDFEIEKDEAKEKMDKISDAMRRLSQRDIDKKYIDNVRIVDGYVGMSGTYIISIKLNKEKELLKYRNILADILNEPQRKE